MCKSDLFWHETWLEGYPIGLIGQDRTEERFWVCICKSVPPPDCNVWERVRSPRRNFSWISVRAFSWKSLQNLHIFDELMIYFVSYVFGLAKIVRENSENAISDDPETPNFRNFSAWRQPWWHFNCGHRSEHYGKLVNSAHWPTRPIPSWPNC
jgi:predicted RNA-binding protein with PUA-like domain